MKKRMFFYSALLSGLAVIITSVLITAAAYGDFIKTIQREIVAETTYIQTGVELAGLEYLENLDYAADHRVTWIDSDGAVLYDSLSSPSTMDNHLERPEVLAALATGTGESTRFSATQNEQTYYFAVQLSDGTVLRMASTISTVTSFYNQLIWLVVLIALAVILLSGLAASLLTRRIVRPLNALDLEHPENNEAYDEIVPLLARIKDQRVQIDAQISELDRSRAEFAAITENMNEGFLVLDKDGRVLSHNASAVRLLSVLPENPDGMNILELNRSEVFRNALEAALDGVQREHIIELGERHCQLFASPVRRADTLQGVILLLVDVTERQAREKLRREFTANVSHELKTPLTAISGYAEIMASGMARAEDIPEFSGCIYEEAKRLIALIKDLMFLSKLDENVLPTREPVELLPLVEGIAHRLKQLALECDVEVRVFGEAAAIMGTASIVEEMVYNLLENAIKYNHAGGSASVTIEKVGSTGVKLVVSDTGIGIPPDESERVFERFYRVDKSHNEAVEGTGLGLAIVKHGALLHEAKMLLASSSEGSSFTLIFPVH